MSKATLPETLPGRYYVLEWKAGFVGNSPAIGKRFVLTIDDANHSSYNLGTDVQKVMMQFRIWGQYDLGCKAIDIAKEFGACQVIPSQNRTLAIFDRGLKNPQKIDFTKEDRANAVSLPSLG